MRSVALADLIGFLDNLDSEGFQGGQVTEYLSTHRVESDDWAQYIYFRDDCYGRNLVSKSPHYELVVLTWLPNQKTPVHCHAGQRCWMFIQQGQLVSTLYPAPEHESAPLGAKGTQEIYRSGEAFYIDDGVGVHSIANPHNSVAVSVHLYAAPIPECRVYCEERCRFEWKALKNFSEYGQLVGKFAQAVPSP